MRSRVQLKEIRITYLCPKCGADIWLHRGFLPPDVRDEFDLYSSECHLCHAKVKMRVLTYADNYRDKMPRTLE